MVLAGCGGDGELDAAGEPRRTVSDEDGASANPRLWSPWVGQVREKCRFYSEEAERLEWRTELVETPADAARFFERVSAHYRGFYQGLKLMDPAPPAQRTEASLIEYNMRDLARIASRLSAAAARRDEPRGRFLARKAHSLIEDTNSLAEQVAVEPCWFQL